ncbi:PAS domain S-box-containing protein [Desulfacinum infernum DSM 9756]|uniref:histidine kinase n=1 Tax=Desulfacinum infernum DSM 9756 TaxID=1121391 RepID=A0A1M5GGA3_9BACT|nr:ATP-binding protein [Desulfacinum infernum]SHG02531.1 PAS domain S-box-containing protein [Desulfacinum infernum DSM 9756]
MDHAFHPNGASCVVPIHYLSAILACLQAIDRAAASIENPGDLARIACRCLSEKGVFSRCAVVFLDPDSRPMGLAQVGFASPAEPPLSALEKEEAWPPCFSQARKADPAKSVRLPRGRCTTCPFSEREVERCDFVAALNHNEGFIGFLAASFPPDISGDETLAHLCGELARNKVLAFRNRMGERRRREALRQLKEKEHFLATLFRALPSGVGLVSNRRFLFVNEQFCRMFGYREEELIDRSVLCCYAGEAEYHRAGKHIYEQIQKRGTGLTRARVRKKDGSLFHALLAYAPMDPENPRRNLVFSVTDITRYVEAVERAQQMKQSLLRAQKMEALGTLAGGIAHDFNNILSAIMGYTDLALLECPPEGELRESLEEIRKAGLRAKNLVRQILTISRRQPGEREPLLIAPIVKEVLKFMRAALPATITIETNLQDEDALVEADPTEIHQVLMNLCTNAGHAMRKTGGRLTVSVRCITVDRQVPLRMSTLEPGPYAEVSVADTGEGMTPHVLERAFDPYFTTKPPGEGTGLGLATVQAVVRKCGGAVDVASQPGQGTTFTLYFPRKESSHESTDISTQAPLAGGRERIALVDDEKAVVDAGTQILTKLGYQVQSFTDPERCLQEIAGNPGTVDLLVTDLIMPHLTGDRLALEVKRHRPDLPMILITGRTEEVSVREMKSMGIDMVLKKPFSAEELTQTIRKILDAAKEG